MLLKMRNRKSAEIGRFDRNLAKICGFGVEGTLAA